MSTVKEDLREHTRAIYETIVDELASWRQFARETWPLLVLLFLAVAIALWFAKPAPPNHVLMGTGSKGGSYEPLAQKYVEYFAKHGVTLELVKTQGADNNIKRLSDASDPLQAAFIQGGLVTDDSSTGLQSLGSVAYEPVWFFYRNDRFEESNHNTADFLTEPMGIGEIGSGTYRQALHILQLNDLELNNNLKSLPTNESVEALIRGDLSSIFITDGIESANIQRLINEKTVDIRITNFDRAAAYTRLMPYFHELVIPHGSLGLSRNFPDKDIKLIAPTTNLIIDKNMHPAIQLLFLQAAREINGGRTFFSKYGEFPKFMESFIEESPIAKRFYEKGSPFLMNYLPFWLAEFIDRLFILILPLFAFIYPIMKTMPGYRTNRAQSRINEIYGSLKFFENELSTAYDPALHNVYLEKIDALEKLSLALRVPKALGREYYNLRTNIDFVRKLILRNGSRTAEQLHFA